MNRTTREILLAVRDGREFHTGSAAVTLGTNDCRYVRINGMLIASVRPNIATRIKIPVADKRVIDTLNALLLYLHGDAIKVGMTTKHRMLFVSHPKQMAIGGKVGIGTTFLDVNEWWDIPTPPTIPDER